jgi:anti-anti-sigma factor
MATPVTVSRGRGADGQPVVTATGELDMSNIDSFNRVLAEALAQADGKPVKLDLRGVEYLDSVAINALFPQADRVRLLANPILMPVLRISGLTDVMRVELDGHGGT